MSRAWKILPGPGNIAVQALPDNHEIDVGGGKKLWVPSATQNEGMVAKVVAVSQPWHDGTQVIVPNYDLGDLVVIGKFTGTRLSMGREAYTILREQDVLCKLTAEEVPDAAEV